MSLLYYIGTCLNILCNCRNLHSKKTMFLFHVYFYIMAALVWKGEILNNNCIIFFSTDLLNEIITKRVTSFLKFHHILMIIFMLISKLSNEINSRLIDISLIFELSSIPLSLFYMGYIPKPIYNLLFSYSFIFIRLVYFNYNMYMAYLEDKNLYTNTAIVVYSFLNIMNCGIAWKMKLFSKLFAVRPAIDYLCDKQPKSS